MSDLKSLLANERRKVIRAIKHLIEPHFRDSGFRTAVVSGTPIGHPAGRRPVRMYAPAKPVLLRGAFKLEGFWALSEFGPVVDAIGGGMSWEAYSEFPLEDLIKLKAWAERTFNAPTPSPDTTGAKHGR